MKSRIKDLAVFGGTPAFTDALHVGRPNLGDRERLLSRINEILDRNWLTNGGPCVKEFERRIAGLVGVKHCIATCNGTVALELAIRALDLSGEVIMPAFTFVATAHALQWQGITPVFCDIGPENYTIDPTRIEKLLTPRTTGIIGVHLWGKICDVSALAEIARRRNLKLMFDASHAFGCSHTTNMVGTFGDAEVFSFHATKFINAFEGGAIVTNDDILASKLRLMKNFGFVGNDEVGYIGTNGKMSEASAAMGLTSLESMDTFIVANHRNYAQYRHRLHTVPGLRLLEFDETEQRNFQYITLNIDQSITGIDRDEIIRVLRTENILARRYFYPGCHNMEPYRSYFPQAKLLLPNTERIMRRVLCLPTGKSVSEEEIDKICDLIDFIISLGPEIRGMLSGESASLSNTAEA